MSIANIPFPSFTLVLTSDRVVIPGPSYVIRLAPLVVSHPQVRQAIEPANIILDDGINLNFENDSMTPVAFGHELVAETMMSMVTDGTRMVQTTSIGLEKVEKKLSFPFLKTRSSQKYYQAFLNIFRVKF